MIVAVVAAAGAPCSSRSRSKIVNREQKKKRRSYVNVETGNSDDLSVVQKGYTTIN